MAVEQVKVPKRIFTLDPREKPSPAPPNSAEYWDGQAKAARARREYVEETQMAERLAKPEIPPDPAFKFKGEVDLGKIDIQEQQKLAAEATERARTEARERITKAEQDRDEARQALNAAQLAHMHAELGGKIEQLQNAIAANNRVDIADQLAGIEKLAGMLGYQKPVAGPTDGNLTLELKKLDWQMQRENRDFQRQMKHDERTWQIELRKLDQGAQQADARLQQEREKFTMLASAPERVGAVIAKAIMENANGRAASDQSVSKPSKKRMTYHAEALEGEADEIPCPNCETPIGIAPNARRAECVNCHTKLLINRLPAGAEETSDFIA